MKQLVIIRGLPGSGKSTLALKVSNLIHAPIFEADMWFYDKDDKDDNYNFNNKELVNAHKFCKMGVEQLLKSNNSCIVSNTTLTEWALNSYIELGNKYNYEIKIIHCLNEYNNIHNVSFETLINMKQSIYYHSDEFYYLEQGSYSPFLSFYQLIDNNKKYIELYNLLWLTNSQINYINGLNYDN